MNNFPYPILTEIGSSYGEDIHFTIECLKYYVENNNVNIEIKFDLNSEFLLGLISDDKANIVLNINTSIVNKVDYVKDINNNYTACIPISNIKNNDSIYVTSQIIAKDYFDLVSNKEFNEIYSNLETSIRKGDRLAISNKEKLSFYTENNNFIRFKTSEEIENGYKVRLASENFIEVLVPVNFTKAYKIISRKRAISMVVDSNIVFEVLVYTLIQISQFYQELKKKPWCESLSRMFDECGEDIENFVEISFSEGKLNVDLIYEMVHKLTNNQVVNSVIKSSDNVRMNGDNE